MSCHESPVNDCDNQPKRRIQRRHGACEPCRSSKTKCDGRTPCGACRSERRRQCPCVYSEKAMKLQQVTAEIRRRAESEKQHGDDTLRPYSEDESSRHAGEDGHEHMARAWVDEIELPTTGSQTTHEPSMPNAKVESASMQRSVSICAVVEEFRRLKPARGYCAQVISRCNGFEVSRLANEYKQEAHSPLPQHPMSSTKSTTSKSFPATRSLEVRLGEVDSSIQRGHLDRAWIDLAPIVREAQLLQERQSAQTPATKSAWENLWHKILDLESQVGLTTGRSIGLVLPKQVRSKSQDDTLSLEDSIEETKTDLYQHIQGILALNVNDKRAIRDFLERAYDILHHEPFNRIGLCTTDSHSAAVRDLHLNTHLLFMVTHCRMAMLCDVLSRDLTNASWSDTPAADIIRKMKLDQPRQKLAYCRRMFRSANFILDSFFSLHQDDEEQTGRLWLRCHSAYVAAQVLGIAKLRHEVEWHATTEQLTKLEHIFSRLSKAHPQCDLFSTASSRLDDLNSVEEPASEVIRHKHSGSKRHRNKQTATSSEQTSQKLVTQQYSNSTSSSSTSPTVVMKRNIDMVDDPVADNNISYRERFANQQHDYQLQDANSSFEDVNLDPLFFFQDNSATYSQSSSSYATNSANSSATSFSESDMPIHAIADLGLNHPGPPFAFPFPYGVFHPPMAWNNPPYIMPSHNDELSLQIPLEPAFQYAIQNNSDIQFSNVNSHTSSPLQPHSDGTVTSMRLSPAIQNRSGFRGVSSSNRDMADHNRCGQGYSQQVKTPLTGSGISNSSGRPGLDRKNSTNPPHPSPPLTNETPEPSSKSWHPTSTVAVSHEVERQLASQNLNASDVNPQTGRSDIANSAVSTSHGRAPYYTHSVTHQPPPPQALESQSLLPEQIAYMNSTGAMLGTNQYHSTYQHAHQLPPFPNGYIASAGPTPEQWRRMSIGAVDGRGTPY